MAAQPTATGKAVGKVGAAYGAKVGATFGPLGVVVGGALGALAGSLFGKKKQCVPYPVGLNNRAVSMTHYRGNPIYHAAVNRQRAAFRSSNRRDWSSCDNTDTILAGINHQLAVYRKSDPAALARMHPEIPELRARVPQLGAVSPTTQLQQVQLAQFKQALASQGINWQVLAQLLLR